MTRLRMALEDDEVRVLRLLEMPRTKAEISEATGLGDERLGTVLQKLRRNGLAQLTGGKRWEITELGSRKLEESEKEEEPEPPRKESFTEKFNKNRKRRDLLNLCESLSSTLTLDWGWERDLMKDVESMRGDVDFIERSLNEVDSVEELEELERLLQKVDRSWDNLYVRNCELSEKRLKIEKDRKMRRIRELYLEEYPDLPDDYLEELLKELDDDPERFNEIYQRIEREEHLERLLDKAAECGIHPAFVQYLSDMAAPKKLGFGYILKVWDDYDVISYRYGTKVAKGFLDNYGPNLLKRGGDLWTSFRRHMPPPRRPAPVY